ncbi:hypothetical protein GGR50DRAFT_91350 [Xylaria sp. CBS 124048]|nr:hypothetical protein GGR50DRAFT_91350 [Xylaria sp. CBS 124048]
MGQNSSQLQEEGNEPSNENLQTQRLGSHSDSDEHAASDASVPSSTIDPSSGRRNQNKFSSSLRSPRGPPPTLSPQMAGISPSQQLPPMSSILSSLGDEHTPRSSKKKKRNRKKSSQIPPSGETPQSSASHLPHGLDSPDDDIVEQQRGATGDVDIVDSTLVDTHEKIRDRSHQKKDRKERKRAAKLAKLQAAAVSALEVHDRSINFAETSASQEHDIIETKIERREEEEQAEGSQLIEHPDTVPKKRKRKSRAQTEEELQQSPKKQKSSHNDSTGVTSGSHDGQADDIEAGDIEADDIEADDIDVDNIEADDIDVDNIEADDIDVDNIEADDIDVDNNEEPHHSNVEEDEHPHHSDTNEKEHHRHSDTENEQHHHSDVRESSSAKQIYSSRRRRPRRSDIPNESELSVETRAEPNDVKTNDGNDRRESEADDVAEAHRDDTTNFDSNLNDATTMTSSASASSIKWRRSGASSRGANGTVYSTRNDALVTTGFSESEIDGREEQNGAGVDEELASANMDGTADDNVEVPSTMPHLANADEFGVKNGMSTRSSSARKRMVKPDFFSRMETPKKIPDSQSPSNAASKRKTGNGKKAAAVKNGTPSGQLTTNSKPDRLNFSTKMKASLNAERADEKTPSKKGGARLRTPNSAAVSGVFTDFENQSVRRVIDQYKDENGMSQSEVNELIQDNPKRAAELWEAILTACPGRNRQRVINHTRRKYHNFVARGSWTPEQDQELGELFERYGNKYAKIGQYINRHPEDIRDRIRNYLVCGSNLKKAHWSQEETNKLITIVEQAITEIRRLRVKRGLDDSQPLEDDINWQLVSQGMDRTRSRLQCISKWKAIKPHLAGGGLDGVIAPMEDIIKQARETAATMSHHNRSLIIEEILKSGAVATGRIPWNKVRARLGSQWTRAALMVVWFRLQETLPNKKKLNVEEACRALLEEFRLSGKLEFPDVENDEEDYDSEYQKIEKMIERSLKTGSQPKSARFIHDGNDDVESDEESEEDVAASNGEAEETHISEQSDRLSVDLGASDVGEKEAEIEDSEPEANTSMSRYGRPRPGGGRSKFPALQLDRPDDMSSDTNASEVESIPAV